MKAQKCVEPVTSSRFQSDLAEVRVAVICRIQGEEDAVAEGGLVRDRKEAPVALT